MENIVLKASDGYALSLAVFEREHPRGYIQIIHGMEEHKERYEAFAEQLRQVGFTVVTSDMRGHGEHAPKLGFFKEKDGDRYSFTYFEQVFIDMSCFYKGFAYCPGCVQHLSESFRVFFAHQKRERRRSQKRSTEF